jgi:hypothetical protein
MNQEVLLALLTVQQQESGLWEAFLPEHPMFWTVARTPEEVRTNWLREYDVPMLYPAFESVQRIRAVKRPSAQYHLDKWHQGMTDQELQDVYKNLLQQLQRLPRDEYYWFCMNTLLFAQVEQALRCTNEGKGK